jgi:hypothetical protein
MPKEFLFFDSTYSTKIYDAGVGKSNLLFYHPFNITHSLKAPIRNIKQISLKSVEMPLLYIPIRINNFSNRFSFTFSYEAFNNINISVNVSPAFHTISTLLENINSNLVFKLAPYPGVSVVLSANDPFYPGAPENAKICRIVYNCTSFELDVTPMNDILGFTNRRSTIQSPFDSTAPINFNAIDTCAYIQILNLPVSNINLNQNVSSPFSFKIPFNSSYTYGSTLYFNDSNEQQSITINNPNFLLDKLDIKVVDRLGYQLPGIHNWTATFIIEYDEDVTKNQIPFLNIYD